MRHKVVEIWLIALFEKQWKLAKFESSGLYFLLHLLFPNKLIEGKIWFGWNFLFLEVVVDFL